ncbi:MAG: polysaccharide deacetylase family protein, partial [Bacteroidales bacterium]|nr:polysaccharide deacetylase family protein [Bacteroidales bacterium]
MCWIAIILLICLTLFLVWASADVGGNIYLKSLCRGDRADKLVTLTFDDGPDEVMTPKVLDVLQKHDIKATFFVIGSKVEKFPHIAKRIVAEGHTIANHTYSHKATFPMS